MLVCAISDLHGQLPKAIPPCDLLLVAGDVCPDRFSGVQAKTNPDRQLQWFENEFVSWAEDQPAEFIVVTWGNHDWCGHLVPNGQRGKRVDIVSDAPMLINGIKLWFTPWSNEFMGWAWMKRHADLAEVYAKIPDDVDILVSHQPPYGCGDVYPDPVKMAHIGSSELLHRIEQIKPRIVVCGHLHGGHGTYQHGETTIYNVSLLDEGYNMKYAPTMFTLEARDGRI